MAQLNFDASTVQPAAALDPIPAGWYNCQMTKSEMKPTSDGQGAYLEAEFTVLDGPYVGRKVFDRINLQNKNPIAVEIGYKTLSAICHAVGVIQVADSQQLHGRPLQVKVSLRNAETGADGKQYDASNDVKGYKAIGQGAPASAPGGFQPQPGPAQGGWGAPPAQQPACGQAPAQQPAQQTPPAWGAAPAGQPAAAPAWQPQPQPQPGPAAAPWGAPPAQQPQPQQQAQPQQGAGGPVPPWMQGQAGGAPAQQQPVAAPAGQPGGPTPPWAQQPAQ